MRRQWLSLFVALAFAGIAGAAQTPSQNQTGLIVGQVIDAATQAPVASALVTVSLQSTKVLTDPEGHFVFGSLSPGPYAILATKAGYLDGAYGRKRAGGTSSFLIVGSDLAATTNIKILLFRPAVISGIVRDDAGEPVVNVDVQVYRRSIVGNLRQWSPAGAAGTTDDRGFYRVSGLVPGEYVAGIVSRKVTLPMSVAAAAVTRAPGWESSQSEIFEVTSIITVPGGSSAPTVGAFALQEGLRRGFLAREPRPDGSFPIYPTIFYPAAPSAKEAAAIKLGSGEERTDINLTGRLVPSVSVSGRVVGPSGPAGVCAIRLIAEGTDALSTDADNEAAAGVSDQNGAFTLLGVPQGQYRLLITKTPKPSLVVGENGGATLPPIIPDEPALWAAETLAVGSTPITNLTVRLQTGARVSGRVEFSGQTKPPTADRLPQIMLALEPVGGVRTRSPIIGRPDQSGAFKTYAAPPGRYVLGVSPFGGLPPGWNLKSATLAGRDIADAPFDLAGRDITDVVVTFVDRQSNVGGTVMGANGKPDVDAVALAFPTDSRAWTDEGAKPRRLQATRPDSTGAFTWIGLPAGEYFVIAVTEELFDDWPSPALLQKLGGLATRLTVTGAAQGGVSLKTSVVR